jgi:hypothetical protein
MPKRWIRMAALAAGLALGSGTALAQPPAALPPLRVFLDCNRCDTDYVTQNVTFVDYVRDRTVADVHVLVTTQETGGGGLAWTVAFLGQARFAGQDRTLTFNTTQLDSSDVQRKAFVRVFKLGLVSYAVDTSVSPNLDVTYHKPDGQGQTTAENDPWNYWVFRISFGGNLNGESSSHNESYRFSVTSNRTTNAWKINLGVRGDYNTNTFHFEDEDTIRSLSNSWNVDALIVKSAGPHWSYGGRTFASHATFSNNDHTVGIGPALEYDIFPYSESTRRLLTLRYTIGVDFHAYEDLTIFDRLHDTTPLHSINVSLALRQPWGSLNLSTNTSQHLDDLSRRRLSLFGNADVRLFKGFSFDAFGGYDKINDQIDLRKAAASTEDVLLHVQQLATSYSYFLGFGINYRFGSIFNNIVNPRFGD